MNPNPTTASSVTSPTPASADAISRRAYELWEQDGKPDGNDLQHWLQAERELSGGQQSNGQSNGQASHRATQSTQPAKNTDTRPLQGTRGGGVVNREPKRSTTGPTATAPFGDRAASSSGGQTAGTKRR